jgi:hypothetical protein
VKGKQMDLIVRTLVILAGIALIYIGWKIRYPKTGFIWANFIFGGVYIIGAAITAQ